MTIGFTGSMKDLNEESPEYDYAELATFNYAQLARAKSEIETALDRLFTLLTEKYNFDMDSPLVVDDFPRADIDVVLIRMLRIKIIRLRNDHREVLRLLETKLAEQFRTGGAVEVPEQPAAAPTARSLTPFALVQHVAPASPAAAAGLLVNDKIVLFGNLTSGGLAAISEKVRLSVGQKIRVAVLRGSRMENLDLTPGPWAGRGLLGCQIVQYPLRT